ncbi:MAG: hypothetical protein ACYTDY_06385, partial [Planctomycetota bacterium]
SFGTVNDLGSLASLDELLPFSDWWYPGYAEAGATGKSAMKLGSSGRSLTLRLVASPRKQKLPVKGR